MENITLHNNVANHNNAEGFYIGSTRFSEGETKDCGEGNIKLYPHEIHGLTMRNNQALYNGAEGIQIGAATKDVEVSNNQIFHSGHKPFSAYQVNGMQLGQGTTGYYHGNLIANSKAFNLIVIARGNILFENNSLINAGARAILVDDRNDLGPYDDDLEASEFPFIFNKNLIKGAKSSCAKFYSKQPNVFTNNICADVIKDTGPWDYNMGSILYTRNYYDVPVEAYGNTVLKE